MSENFSNRRSFVKTSLLAGAGIASGAKPVAALAAKKGDGNKLPHEFCTFTKPLQHFSYDKMSDVIAEIGFDGVEAPVRPGGHVVPEKVEEDLPKMMEALKRNDLKCTVMTSAINEVSDEQKTETVLRTAAKLGVERYRMGYYKYDLKKPIAPQLDEFRPKLKDLIAMSKELGIKPVYQNHSGKNYFGGPIWDIHEVFQDFDPADIGVAFDIGHGTIEGAKAWPLNFALIRPYLDTVYVKEPHWYENKLTMGAVGEGAVDKAFYKTLKQSKFTGPISLHIEYLGHKDPKVIPAVLKAMKNEFAVLKKLLAES